MKFSKQMSESIKLGVILAIAGGFMDAYSYMCRGKVFANAQTGNILLLGINISERNWHMALHYLVPVLAFAIGIALADLVKIRTKDLTLLHWRQISVFCEAVILLSVSFIPQDFNLVANALTSLACGIQVESFRKSMETELQPPCASETYEVRPSICAVMRTRRIKSISRKDFCTMESSSSL